MTTAPPMNNEVWQCPACQTQLRTADSLLCPQCRQAPVREGRLLDFSLMTPKDSLGLARMVEEVHQAVAGEYPDESDSWRVKRALRMVTKLARGGSVLEIGGANGPMTPRLESVFERVFSIDHCPEFVRSMLARTKDTVCVLGDALHLPWRDHSLQFVLCTEVLEHVVVPTQLLLEIRRVLEPDGILYLTVPNCREGIHPFRVRAKGLLAPDETHVNFYGLRGLQHVVTRCGFRILRVSTRTSVSATLRAAWRRPQVLRDLFPAWGTFIECVAQPVPDPIPYWQSFVSRWA
jgi:SAM-dependent methyltransferase